MKVISDVKIELESFIGTKVVAYVNLVILEEAA